MVNTDKRITIVDGYRCMAILAVMAYHYLYRFSPPLFDKSYYPYEYPPSIFRYGFFGVQLFFVISGFVIFQTLGNTKSIQEFGMKRLIRLWPAMILCSVLTFFVVMFLDQDNQFPILHSASLLNFIPSWVFIPPAFWNTLLSQNKIDYVDGVYWSLFVEVVFYAVGGIVFFAKPKSFLKNWLWITLIVNSVRVATSPKLQFLLPDNMNTAFAVIYNFYFKMGFGYWIYFALGIFFFSLYSKEKPSQRTIVMMALLVLAELYFLGNNTLRFLFVGIIGLFLLLIYKENWLSFLRYKVFVWIGLISYPLYLLHQNIGLILINRIADLTNHTGAQILPFIVSLVLIALSSIIFIGYEKPVASFLKARFVKFYKSES